MPFMSDDFAGSLAWLRHNKVMPSRLDAPDMPRRAAAAQKAIASSSRLTAIRFLLNRPSSSRPEIVAATGMSPATARIALLELEELGYVSVDIDGPRNGRSIRYSANRAALTDDLSALFAWTLR